MTCVFRHSQNDSDGGFVYVRKISGNKKRPGKLRWLFQRQSGKCVLCGGAMTMELKLPNTATLDHKLPRSLGGSNKPYNLQAACARCNNAKGSKFDEAMIPLLHPKEAKRFRLIKKP